LLVRCLIAAMITLGLFHAATAADEEPTEAKEANSVETAADASTAKLADRVTAMKQALGEVRSRVVGSPDPPLPYRAERVLTNIKPSWPVFMIRQPGSRRLWVIDQKRSSGPARLCRTSDPPEAGELETLLEIPFHGVAYSIAFHPRFEENGYVYIGWNGAPEGRKKHCFITRYTMSRQPPYHLDLESALTIIEWPSNGHNGAAIDFGTDGMLYITSGDGTSDSDTDEMGQGLNHLLAKVLRIDVDHTEDGRAYRVPKDNPFYSVEGARPETWAYGFRNPWRLHVDRQSGDIWVGNNGQDLWEQVYLVQRGANYGWSVYEGSEPFYPNRQLGPTRVSKPTFDHPHSEARSLTGGIVYYGDQIPELHGAYVYGDYSTGKIWAAKVEAGEVLWHKEIADTTLQITAFAVDAAGRLLIADHRAVPDGGFYTLVPNIDDGSSGAFPRTLSDSGLFLSVHEHQMHPGVVPFSVNSPLWSDGSHKERFMALPAEDPTIQVRKTRGWDFPDQTVLVKSFALELDENDPTSRRWIETRFLTKQQGEWAGYSYIWNEEQTDATLVTSGGADRTYPIRTSDGETRQQQWRFPSRSECMVCHSRAANFVLGPTSLQMNRDHDYGGVMANQLTVLDQLGVLQSKTAATAERLVDPYDDQQDLTARARSYLHANCSHCHIEAGGGNSQINLEYGTPMVRMKVLDVVPLHHTFDLPGARLIAPGAPERSVLLHRVANRGRSSGQMPQLATTRIDERAAAMLREWIEQLPLESKND
jgi:uncharacterized repeat protein (TIGR03806 family)